MYTLESTSLPQASPKFEVYSSQVTHQVLSVIKGLNEAAVTDSAAPQKLFIVLTESVK